MRTLSRKEQSLSVRAAFASTIVRTTPPNIPPAGTPEESTRIGDKTQTHGKYGIPRRRPDHFIEVFRTQPAEEAEWSVTAGEPRRSPLRAAATVTTGRAQGVGRGTRRLGPSPAGYGLYTVPTPGRDHCPVKRFAFPSEPSPRARKHPPPFSPIHEARHRCSDTGPPGALSTAAHVKDSPGRAAILLPHIRSRAPPVADNGGCRQRINPGRWHSRRPEAHSPCAGSRPVPASRTCA